MNAASNFSANASSQNQPLAVIVLAAGAGTRMKSDLPKPLHPANGKPLLGHVLDMIEALGATKVVVVGGHGYEQTARFVGKRGVMVEQTVRLGTGHAVMQAEPVLGTFEGPVVVVSGDTPLITRETTRQLVETQRRLKAECVVLSFDAEGKHAYGRIVRGRDGNLERIVEHLNATEEERKINEVNSGMYCFKNGSVLFGALAQVTPDPVKKEYYLTDVVAILRKKGVVGVVKTSDPSETIGVNTPEDLAEVERLMRLLRPSDSR